MHGIDIVKISRLNVALLNRDLLVKTGYLGQ